MDPYIDICRDREFVFQNFNNFFELDGEYESNESFDYSTIKSSIKEIINNSNIHYQLSNSMFKSYQSIVLCNLDAIFNFSGVKYHITLKTLDKEFKFCQLGGSDMSEYFLWRFYNAKGYGIMNQEEYKAFPLNNKHYTNILPPIQIDSDVPKEYLPGKDYMSKRLLEESSGNIDLLISNKDIGIEIILDVVKTCMKENGNCVILLSDFGSKTKKLTELLTYFKRSALIKPMSTDKVYLVLLNKRSNPSKAVDLDGISKYFKDYSRDLKLNDKKEVLYYLNRANIHFFIY